jgi:hypothetical protein
VKKKKKRYSSFPPRRTEILKRSEENIFRDPLVYMGVAIPYVIEVLFCVYVYIYIYIYIYIIFGMSKTNTILAGTNKTGGTLQKCSASFES